MTQRRLVSPVHRASPLRTAPRETPVRMFAQRNIGDMQEGRRADFLALLVQSGMLCAEAIALAGELERR